jgi:enterochelin esterase family protein
VVTDTVAVRRSAPDWLNVDALDERRGSGGEFPVLDGETCTFAFQGPAVHVRFVHFGVGLPDDLSFELLDEERGWWVLTLQLPHGTRLEYKLEVADSFGTRLVEDPLNWRAATHPFGANSVCEATGYTTPDFAIERDDVPRGSFHDVTFDSAALGRPTATTVYQSAGAADGGRCPLVIVHDGPDYLRYAAASTVLDNLVHGAVLPPLVAAFVDAGDRLVEYADDPRHHEYLAGELLPRLEADLPAGGDPARRCLVGASFGAVASLSAAARHPELYGRLLLQSGSFAGAGTGCWPRPEGLWRPVKQFVHGFLDAPRWVAERVYVTCGVFESLICENRGLVPVLRDTGMDVEFVEQLGGHTWEAWRDGWGLALPALLSG